MHAEGIDNLTELTAEEAQAMSILDTLNYVDEDASLVKQSYDMSNPEERAKFIKSSIKFYERNFKEFKPAAHYDGITDSMAELIEKGDGAGTLIDNNGNEVPVSDIMTGSVQDLRIAEFKKNLLKVLKLLSKSLLKIEKGFE